MTRSALLDFWQPPPDAGAPLAVLATTFVLEPDFFETDCLARFLSVQSVDFDRGAADETVARIELEERLTETTVTVLADRSAGSDRGTLRWDLLQCHVQRGLLHSKVAVLMWEHATRVIIGSTNLTAAGYRRQLELAFAADLGPQCLIPSDELIVLADELEAYLGLIPGAGIDVPAVSRAAESLRQFRERCSASARANQKGVVVAVAPTNPLTSPLDLRHRVWSGRQPVRALQVSPFWDADGTAVARVRAELSGHPKAARMQTIATSLSPHGGTTVGPTLRGIADAVLLIKEDRHDPPRTLHAKALVIASDDWVAAMIGSSNHTMAGLGLSGSRHRELNVWLGASRNSAVGRALVDLVPTDRALPVDTPTDDQISNEDETGTPSLPLGFELCRVVCAEGHWLYRLHLNERELPTRWIVSTSDAVQLVDDREWRSDGAHARVDRPIDVTSARSFVIVDWWEGDTRLRCELSVVVDDPSQLPPGPQIADLTFRHLFAALVSGKPLSEQRREQLESCRPAGGQTEVDPLRRFDDPASLLRRGRELANVLAGLERRLSRPVATVDQLRARLASPLSPAYLASKVVEEARDSARGGAEATFFVAELALSVGRVDWTFVLQRIDRKLAVAELDQTLDCLEQSLAEMFEPAPMLAAYAARAIEEARRCTLR